MSHAIRIHGHGGPETLRWEEVDVGRPSAGEVRLRHEAIGLNFIDVYHREGTYPVPSLPSGLGLEAAGVIEETGDGVEGELGFRAGDRVAYATGPIGAYAEERVMPAASLVPLPDHVDGPTAAAALLKGMTAEYLIRRCRPVQAGEVVLVHAAAGGVGQVACQWLSAMGARVIGTVGSEAKLPIARDCGCEHVFLSGCGDLAERVREVTGGRGVPVVFDGVGRDTFHDSLDCLAPRGMLVSFGNASGPVPAFEPLLLSEKGSLYLTRPRLFDYVAGRVELLASANALFEVLRTGQVAVSIQRSFPLREASDAHRALERRETTGSTLLIPERRR